MKTKKLRSITQSLSDMAISGRLSESLDELVTNIKGIVEFDLISEKSTGSNAGAIKLPIFSTLQNWFKEELDKNGIQLKDINSAVIRIQYDSGTVATDRERTILFNLQSETTLNTEGRTVSSSASNKLWHDRKHA